MLVANSINNRVCHSGARGCCARGTLVFASGQEGRIKAPDTNFNVTGYVRRGAAEPSALDETQWSRANESARSALDNESARCA
jgi:hypothetical protein